MIETGKEKLKPKSADPETTENESEESRFTADNLEKSTSFDELEKLLL